MAFKKTVAKTLAATALKMAENHYVVISEVIYVNHSYYFTIVDPNNYNNGSLCGKHSIPASDAYENSIVMLWGSIQ